MTLRIFISSQNIDGPEAAPFIENLQRNGFIVETSPRSPHYGYDLKWKDWYGKGLAAALDRSDVFIFVVDRGWDSSTWMWQEAGSAFLRKKSGKLRAYYCYNPTSITAFALGMYRYLSEAEPISFSNAVMVLKNINLSTDPPETQRQRMEESFRQVRRDHPRISDLNFRFLSPREVLELRRLVEQSASESEINNFIRGEPNLLSSLLHFADTGHHGGKVYPQQVIRPSVKGEPKGLIPDYLMSGENSEGTSWWVLELKGPGEKIFSGVGENIRLSKVANEGLLQIHKYVDFCKEHQSSMREALKLKNFSVPTGILLMGREIELSDPHRKAMKKALGGAHAPVRIRTWDSLLRSLEHKLAFCGHTKHDPLAGKQLEDWADEENT